MSKLITAEGMKILIEKKKKGEKLPEGWEIDVAKYVSMKEKAMNSWMKYYFDSCDAYDSAVKKEKELHGFGKD